MPTDDPRLEQALHDAAPAVTTSGVVTQVTHRRTQRRRNRRLAAGALAAVVLLVVGSVTVFATRDDDSSPHVAAPGTQMHARVVTGDRSVTTDSGAVIMPHRIALEPDVPLLRPPMLVGTTGLSVASYDPGIEGVAPSRVVRINGAHAEVVNFLARILSIAEGEGARWVLTQNHDPTNGHRVPDTFLKRISAIGAPTSVVLDPESDPVGPIAAVAGAVWIPVRDGVLQYSPKGLLVRRIPLPESDHRVVALLGKRAVVSDGDLLQFIDTASGALSPLHVNGRVIDVDGRTGWWLVDRDGEIVLGGPDPGNGRAIPHLPAGFHATGFNSAPTRSAVVGTIAGAPAIVLLGTDHVRATVVLENAGERSALAWTGPHTVSAVSNGVLSEITVP